jgi:hypothetical protein
MVYTEAELKAKTVKVRLLVLPQTVLGNPEPAAATDLIGWMYVGAEGDSKGSRSCNNG